MKSIFSPSILVAFLYMTSGIWVAGLIGHILNGSGIGYIIMSAAFACAFACLADYALTHVKKEVRDNE